MACEVVKFQEKIRSKFLKDLASHYDKVQLCYCAHKDRIQSVQENLKYYKKVMSMYTILIVCAVLMMFILVFLLGMGAGLGMSNSQYGRNPCVNTLPFSHGASCDIAF